MIYPWHHSAWQQLMQQQQAERLPHALLMVAPAGSGKQAFARALAKQLLCEQNATQACDACASCHWYEQGHHPDFFALTLEKERDTHKIDAIRDLSTKLQQTAHHGGYQVALIEQAGRMTTQASNALLKTLEEPAGQVCLLLTCEQIEDVLPTIRSRCQVVPLPVVDEASAKTWLTQTVGHVSADELESYWQMSQATPLLAKAMMENNLLAEQQKLQTLLSAVDNLADQKRYCDQLAKDELSLWWKMLFAYVLQQMRAQPHEAWQVFYRAALTAYRQWQNSSGLNVSLLLQDLLIKAPRVTC